MIKSARKYAFVAALVLVWPMLFLGSCYYDIEEEMYGLCTSGEGLFNAEILPLMQANCNSAGCHNANDKSAGVVLSSYAEVSKAAQNESFLGSLEYTGTFIRMPMNAAQLDTCQINTIIKWINKGMPND